MPNHTYTQVRIEGKPAILDAFYGKLKSLADDASEENFSFLTEFLGDPADDERHLENWYNARLITWGTKWDVYQVSDVQIKTLDAVAGFPTTRELKCIWHTAWSPPIKAMLLLSKKFDVDVQLKYIDEGLGYVGETTIINGDINKERVCESDEVYRGLYEIFGVEHFMSIMEEMDIDYLQHIYIMSTEFASEDVQHKLEKLIKEYRPA